MTIPEFQELADYICDCEKHEHVTVKREPRMFRLYGKARWNRLNEWGAISLAKHCEEWCVELAYSVLIHELVHIITKQHHTEKFFCWCELWHERFGIFEDRASKAYHGKIYRIAADRRKIPVFIPELR